MLRTLFVQRLAMGVVLVLIADSALFAQGVQVNTGTPLITGGDSWNENFSVGGAIRGRGFSLNWGNMNGPPQGNTPGMGVLNGGASGGLGFSWTQSSNRDAGAIAPSVTGIPGYPSYVGDGSLSPFVIGVTPIIGEGLPSIGRQIPWQQQMNGDVPATFMPKPSPAANAAIPAGANDIVLRPTPLQSQPLQAAQSNDPIAAQVRAAAATPIVSLTEIESARHEEQAALETEVRRQLELGDEAMAADRPNVAVIYYRAALRRAVGPIRNVVIDRLESAVPGSSR